MKDPTMKINSGINTKIKTKKKMIIFNSALSQEQDTVDFKIFKHCIWV